MVSFLWKWLTRSRRGLAVFVPWDQVAPDPVAVSLTDCAEVLEKQGFEIDEVAEWRPSFRSSRPAPKSFDHVILCAHAGPAGVGLAVSPGNARAIRAQWWGPDVPVAHVAYVRVCNGAVLLQDGRWGKLFRHWVSYRSEPTYLHTARSRSRWKSLTAAIGRILPRAKGGEVAERLIRAEYHRTMAELLETEDEGGGDLFTFACFQEAANSLRYGP